MIARYFDTAQMKCSTSLFRTFRPFDRIKSQTRLFFYWGEWRVRMKERWPRATPVTRANHGTDNDRMEAHAKLAGMGDFNCRAEIDLSLRGDLSCVRTIFHSLFPTSLRTPPFPSRSLQCSKRECVFTLRKHLSLLCHVALKATEIEYEIQRVSEIFRYAFMPRLNFLFSPGGGMSPPFSIRWIF